MISYERKSDYCVERWKGQCSCSSQVLNSDNYEIIELLTTVTKDYDRIRIHGVRRVLLKQQAKALRIPLEEVFIMKGASDTESES